jgi:hypothetical protein
MKNAVPWDVAACRYCVNIRFGGSLKRFVPPKRRFTQYLHGATSQKMALFLNTLEFTVTHALGFTVFTSRILVTGS